MTASLAVLFTIVGIAIGSFLNVCIDRLPLRKSLIHLPSHCDSCQHRLSVVDLVPLLSYLFLRGRCRHCHARIPLRVPLVEWLGGMLFLLAFLRFVAYPPAGFEPNYMRFGITAFWGCVFLVIIFIDWEHQLILNRVTLPMAIVALVILGFDSIFPDSLILGNLLLFPEGTPSILSGIIGGATGFIFFLIIFLINPRGMGMGDVKLAGLIGLVTGFPLVIVALLIGIFIGGLVAIVLLALRFKGRKDVIAYGTFLAMGPIVTLLWGVEIYRWYQGLFY